MMAKLREELLKLGVSRQALGLPLGCRGKEDSGSGDTILVITDGWEHVAERLLIRKWHGFPSAFQFPSDIPHPLEACQCLLELDPFGLCHFLQHAARHGSGENGHVGQVIASTPVIQNMGC